MAFVVACLILLNTSAAIIVGNSLPIGDLAADTLLVRRATHGLLLTGHYNYLGVHHPGPYLLYMRALGAWLTTGLVPGSPFGGQLVGGLLNNALFMGLIGAQMQRLLRSEAVPDGRATMLALATLLPLMGGLGLWAVAIFIPIAIILPFTCLLLSVLLLWRGSAGALVVATFCTAVLVHAYIPMPLIAGPLWLLGVAGGIRRRRAVRGRGFPAWAWTASALIIVLFMLPMLLDMVLNPPGNIMLIMQQVMHPSLQTPPPTPWMLVTILLKGGHRLPHYGAMLALTAVGASLALAGFHRALWRDYLILSAATVLVSLLAFARAPTPVQGYWGFYIGGGMLLGGMLTVVSLAQFCRRWRWRLPLVLAVSVAAVALSLPERRAVPVEHRYREMADWIVSQVPLGGRVELLSVRQRQLPAPLGQEKALDALFVASLVVELDWRGVPVCHRNPDAAIIVTPEFICTPQPDPSPVRAFVFMQRDVGPDCATDAAATWTLGGSCIAAKILPDPSPLGQTPG